MIIQIGRSHNARVKVISCKYEGHIYTSVKVILIQVWRSYIASMKVIFIQGWRSYHANMKVIFIQVWRSHHTSVKFICCKCEGHVLQVWRSYVASVKVICCNCESHTIQVWRSHHTCVKVVYCKCAAHFRLFSNTISSHNRLLSRTESDLHFWRKSQRNTRCALGCMAQDGGYLCLIMHLKLTCLLHRFSNCSTGLLNSL